MKKIKNISQLIAKYNSYKITKEELREILKGEPFGRVTGIIGPYVLRYHKDKLIISNRAVIYNASKSEESVQGRKNFASEIKFASVLNNIAAIRNIWQAADLEGRYAFHRIIKYNKMTNGRPSAGNTITPRGFQIYQEELCSLDDELCIRLEGKAEFSKNDNLVIVIVPYDPVDDSDKFFDIISVCCSDPGKSSLIPLGEEAEEICRRYKKYVMYSAVIREYENSVEWSNTIAKEGSIINIDQIVLIGLVLFCSLLFLRAHYTVSLCNRTEVVLYRDG